MTVLRTDRKHASNCMTEENGVEKVKKKKKIFFRSLRFSYSDHPDHSGNRAGGYCNIYDAS